MEEREASAATSSAASSPSNRRSETDAVLAKAVASHQYAVDQANLAAEDRGEVTTGPDVDLHQQEVEEHAYDDVHLGESMPHGGALLDSGLPGGGGAQDDTALTLQLERSGSTSWFVYASAFFVVIASVLGTGILGLPVKLALSGFTPFVTTYTVCFFMQILVLWYMCELLQRGSASMRLRSLNESIGHVWSRVRVRAL
jgi:Tryptophan/tyrosine permease family